MPDSIKYWQVFEDDKQVEIFLQMSDEFANMNIDVECYFNEDERMDACSDDDPFQNQIAGRDIVQLKNNIIPKGLVLLENLFHKNNVARIPKIIANSEDVKDCRIGTQENPKIIKLLKTLSPGVKQDCVKLMKDSPDVFSWSYDDLNVYNTKVIQYGIPLKEDQRLFKRKIRWINPPLLPLIQEVKKLFEDKIIISLRFLK